MLSQIFFFVGLILISLWWFKRKNLKRNEPPAYPGALPIIGHIHILRGDLLLTFRSLLELRYEVKALKRLLNISDMFKNIWRMMKSVSIFTVKAGGVSRMLIGPKIVVYVLTDPDDCFTVLNECLDKSYLYKFAIPWGGKGLIISEVSLWMKNRRLMGPIFTSLAMKNFYNIFNNESRRLANNLANELGRGKFNQYSYILKTALDIVNQSVFGLENEESYVIKMEYVQLLDELLELYVQKTLRVWPLIPFLYRISGMEKQHDDIISKTKAMLYPVIRNRLQNMDTSNPKENHTWEKRTCILDYMLQRFEPDTPIDDIRQHLETFTIASFDSTATTLVFATKLIGEHQNVQELIYQELQEVFGNSERDVAPEDLSKLVYLDAVVKETTRLCPVIPILGRSVLKEIKLKNYTLPAGSSIICSSYGVNINPEWGEDLEQFRPERWLKTERPKNSFASFSMGKRNCIGTTYAVTSLKINLVHILRRYCVMADNTEMIVSYRVLLKAVSGHEIAIKLR